MPVTFQCQQGHKTTVRGETTARLIRCASCGEPARVSVSPTQTETDTVDLEPATPAVRKKRKIKKRQAASPKWKRIALIAGVVVIVAGGAFGIYRLTSSSAVASGSARDREAARSVVTKYLQLSERGDEAGVKELYTDKAKAKMNKQKASSNNGPFRPGMTYQVGEATIAEDKAEVPVTVSEAGGEQSAKMLLRREGDNWRIFGVSVQIIPSDPSSRMTLDFENPENFMGEFLGIDPEEIGKEWESGFKESIKEALKPGPREDDRINEALVAVTREKFDQTWQANLDVTDRPAGEVLKELAEPSNIKLDTTSAQDKALTKKITLKMTGKSRRELIEEVCRKVGFVPKITQRYGQKEKGSETMTLHPAPRQYPITFAGPFVVELNQVNEHAPHATGSLEILVTADNLPVEIAQLLEQAYATKTLKITSVTDAQDRNLVDETNGLLNIYDRSLPAGYNKTFEVPLKNLLRDVTTVKEVKGALRLPLPARIDTLHFNSLENGAIAREGDLEIRMSNVGKAQMQFNNQPRVITNFRLNFKGIRPNQVRVVAYDANKKLIAADRSSLTISGTSGSASFSVQGEAAMIDVKLITTVEVDYEFALKDIRLHSASKMPEKILPLEFPGHTLPLDAEFLNIKSAQFPATAQFRLTNHSNKDIRSVDFKLTYYDATGRQLGDSTSTTCSAPTNFDRKNLSLLMGQNKSITTEVSAPFFPNTARSIKAEVQKVVYADSTEWSAMPAKK